MRFLYTLAWRLALPAVLGRLWWRGRKEPGYRRHLGERLGFYPRARQVSMPAIWVHAVSVGETRAAQPLVEALLAAYPGHRIVLTHMTPTGRATGLALFGTHERVVQSYLPYDIASMVARFIRHFSPRLCVLMETEVWPNLVAQCKADAVPVALVNARLSERSLAKGKRLGALMADAAQAMSCAAAQTEADAARLRQLGAANVHVTGSIKFDVAPPEAALARGEQLRRQIGSRPVLLCASTREGEETLLLDALDAQAEQGLHGEQGAREMLVMIVPRHPQRFDEVAREIEARGLALRRRSQLGDAALEPGVQVLLGDTMGEMFVYYRASDVAFIGGSLLPLGGQNLIEACAVGRPVLIGPHTFNFSAVSEDAIAAGAAQRVEDAAAMLRAASALLVNEDARAAMGERAHVFARQHGGATARTMALLRPLIS